jgi:hypothetical protein
MSDEPKQDQEQIEAARLRLQRVAALAVNAEEAKSAFDDIDALCDAARQPESLVGRRVRIKSGRWMHNRDLKIQHQYERTFYGIGFDGYINPVETLVRDDFEPLEDTDGK